jgi:hypothetical protein
MEFLVELAALGNPQKHTKRWSSAGQTGYSPVEGAITPAMIEEHLKGGEDSLGMYLCTEGTSGALDMTRVLVLDFDDHERKHELHLLESRASLVSALLSHEGVPHLFMRSGSGHGFHIWVLFETPKRVDVVKDMAKEVLTRATRELQVVWPEERYEAKSGGSMFTADPGSRWVHYVEVLPKGAGLQNVALPLGRKSVLMRASMDGNFPRAEEHPDPSSVRLEYVKARKPGPKPGKTASAPDRDAAFDALVSTRDPDNFEDWTAVAMRLIATFGIEDEWAKRRWYLWSKQSPKWDDQEGGKKWYQCRNTRLSQITFWLDAKANGYTGPNPFKTTDERKLTAIAFLDDVRLLRDHVGTAFAQLGSRRFVPVESTEFQHTVARSLYCEKQIVPDDTTLRAVCTLAAAFAADEQPEAINLRFAECGDKRYLFLADDDCTVVEIDASGWRECEEPPVLFRRGDCLPMPMPQPGNIEELIQFLNVDENNMPFVLAWMLTALYFPGKQCPILLLDGTAGTAKSSTLSAIVRMIDPKVGAQSGPPKSEDDLLAAAYGGGVVSFDNVSTLASLSDALCRLSTGGGLRKRKLYTDHEVVALDAKRPIIAAGIDPTMYQQDLIERVVRVELSKPSRYLNDQQFDAMLKEKLPRFTGAILSLLSQAMGMVHTVEEGSSRFSTFTRLGECAARTLGKAAGWFTAEYKQRFLDLAEESAQADSVLIFLIRHLASVNSGETRLEATAGVLWEYMQDELRLGQLVVSRDDVPKNPKIMSSRINRIMSVLAQQHGIRVLRGERRSFVFEWSADVDFDAVFRGADAERPY